MSTRDVLERAQAALDLYDEVLWEDFDVLDVPAAPAVAAYCTHREEVVQIGISQWELTSGCEVYTDLIDVRWEERDYDHCSFDEQIPPDEHNLMRRCWADTHLPADHSTVALRCRAEPVDDLGLCGHHLDELRSDDPRPDTPPTRTERTTLGVTMTPLRSALRAYEEAVRQAIIVEENRLIFGPIRGRAAQLVTIDDPVLNTVQERPSRP